MDPNSTTGEMLVVTLARMEVKLDQLLIESSDHESRIRRLEERPSPARDHESRLRKLEERRWPLPVVSIVFSGMAVGAALLPLVNVR
jgi:hypothetical protein